MKGRSANCFPGELTKYQLALDHFLSKNRITAARGPLLKLLENWNQAVGRKGLARGALAAASGTRRGKPRRGDIEIDIRQRTQCRPFGSFSH